MRFLITGVAGFIGSHLADALVGEHEVEGIDNLLTGRREQVPEAVDFQECELLDAVVRGWDLIIHAAASYSHPGKWERDVTTNVLGCQAVARYGCPVIYFQTSLPPQSSYAISKIAGEQYLRLSGVPLTVFKLANIYGPRNLSGPIPTFCRQLARRERSIVANTARNYVYIDDLVRAVIDSIEQGGTGTYGICGPIDTPIPMLYGLIAHEMGVGLNAEVVDPPETDVVSLLPDAPLPPGWQPTVRLEEGISPTLDWYAAYGVGETYTHLSLTKA